MALKLIVYNFLILLKNFLLDTSIMEIFKSGFNLSDYDVIAFDLDNTLAHYRIYNMSHCTYLLMAKFLVEEKQYPSTHLYTPFHTGTDFMCKGLVLDIEQGNILKLATDSRILKCYHGIYLLTEEEISGYYGPGSYWRPGEVLLTNPLCCWNGALLGKIRVLLDYFDIAVSLVFSRLVTTLDEVNAVTGGFTYFRPLMWRNICESLNFMYCYKHFNIDKGNYFSKLKNCAESYYYPNNQKVVEWLRELRKHKKLIVLISGSDSDFVAHTATQALGANWTELFDLVVCLANKPGFFTKEQQSFVYRDLTSQNLHSTTKIPASDLIKGGIYGNGCWNGVMEFVRRETGIAKPRALYFGDHVMKDIISASVYANIDVVAVIEELAGQNHPDCEIITSTEWGTFLGSNDASDPRTLWWVLLKNYTCLAVSSLEVMTNYSIGHVYLKKECKDESNDTDAQQT